MMLKSVESGIQSVDELISKSDHFRRTDDVEVLGHWARYLCLAVASNIDNCIISIFTEYSRINGDDRIRSFVSRRLSRVSNFRPRKIVEIHRDFGTDWEDRVKKFLNREMRNSINSIFINRNKIAHGESANVSVDMVCSWFEYSQEMIIFIENLVLHSDD